MNFVFTLIFTKNRMTMKDTQNSLKFQIQKILTLNSSDHHQINDLKLSTKKA